MSQPMQPNDGQSQIGGQPLPPMGWFPDPAGSPMERYWDGQQWTSNLRPAQATSPNLPGPQNQNPQSQNPYGPGPQNQNPYGPGPFDSYAAEPANAAGYPGAEPMTADGVRLAGWWQRVGGTIIDSLLMTIVQVLVALPFMSGWMEGLRQYIQDVEAGTAGIDTSPLDPQYGISGSLNLVIFAGYLISFGYGLLMLRFKGRTLGHMVAGYRVVPVDQGHAPAQLSWGQAAARQVTYVIFAAVAIVGLISYIMAAVTEKKQTLHDMIAKTQTVKTR